MKYSIMLLIVFSFKLFGSTPTPLKITTQIYQNFDKKFITYKGPGRFDNFLAMNVDYSQVISLRSQIESALNIKLDYLKKLNPTGEAHITVITPVEFWDVLRSKFTIEEINYYGTRYEIQSSMIHINQIGSAKRMIDGMENETFFLLSDSKNLRDIRWQIYYEFVRRGGDKNAFDPTWFFPHITIGYIGRDLHENDGVIKNLKYTYDNRFNLIKFYGSNK